MFHYSGLIYNYGYFHTGFPHISPSQTKFERKRSHSIWHWHNYNIYIYIQNKHQPSMSRQLLENSGCQIFPFWGMMKFDSKMYDTIKTLPYSALSLGLVSEFLTRVSIILFIFNCARVDQLP